jgi:phosphoglycolate phosphatase
MNVPDSAPRLLVLWDIDHTLIETRGVGRAIYERVFPAATGKPLATLADVTGRTELDIMRETLRINDVEPTDDAVRDLAAALVQGYEDARDELHRIGRALPGAAETLASLAINPAIHQGVLTGNLTSVARIKLDVFNLARYLDLDASAYGDDHRDRAQLVHIAQQRAQARVGAPLNGEHTVLVGDTPHDVAAALTAGVRIVGVATGSSSETELRAAGAHWTVHEATQLPVILNEIIN